MRAIILSERMMQGRQASWAGLFLLFSILFGALVRFAPTLLAGSPINDGGMFYVMIEDLKANRFLLPAFTSYNYLNIPFAYPPLAFYVGGLTSLLGISTLNIIRWVPPFISTLSILAFYWMASLMLDSRSKAALAVFAYALIPRSFSWYVMGGGLSRSFGVLFLLLVSAAAWALFTKPALKYVFLTALFGAGAVLSHPETGLHAAAACALIWLFKGRTARGLRDAAFVALGVVLLTSPWWGTVIIQHGFAPFQSALSTGGHGGFSWLAWITFDFAEERFVTLLTVFGLIGFAVQSIRREWFLQVWMLVPFIVEPRSAAAIAIFPMAILAGIGLSDFVIPNIAALAAGSRNDAQDWAVLLSQSGAARIVMGFVLFIALIGALTYDLTLANYAVPADSRIAMQWVKLNAPADSKFLILTGRPDPFSDPSAEWFPVFAERTSQNTIQGREWLLGKNFLPFRDDLENLQNCLNATPVCLDDWASARETDFNFVYIEKSKQIPALLLMQLRRDSKYVLVYENNGAAIFERK
ncbi:MAG: hypothetical protein HYR70_12805 [Chloroflexi bacterium]|nr:hypothetical protein [Chloroflexota bacterium]MBI3339509.1 hypothetical protein [Chloroflexota bacterium]